MRRLIANIVGVVSLAACICSCHPRLSHTGTWTIHHGIAQDTLFVQFSTYPHRQQTNASKPDGQMLTLQFPIPNHGNEAYFPCTGCQVHYEEGPRVNLVFSANVVTGQMIWEDLKEGKRLKGNLGLRCIMSEPTLEAQQLSKWLNWRFSARWQKN